MYDKLFERMNDYEKLYLLPVNRFLHLGQVKQDRRMKRATKKQVKLAFVQEGVRVSKSSIPVVGGDVEPHSSVFKY